MNTRVRISGLGRLRLDLVPGEEETAGYGVIVSPRARELERALEEGLKVATLLFGRHAAEDVHLVLNQAGAVSVSLLWGLPRQLGLGKQGSIERLLGRIGLLKPTKKSLRANLYYLLLF